VDVVLVVLGAVVVQGVAGASSVVEVVEEVADSQEVDSVVVIGVGEAGAVSQVEAEAGFLVEVASPVAAEGVAGVVDADAVGIDPCSM
jgi:hypothetical protein